MFVILFDGDPTAHVASSSWWQEIISGPISDATLAFMIGYYRQQRLQAGDVAIGNWLHVHT